VIERNACNCFHPTWKPTFRVMATKVLQIASWVLMCLLPWAQHKRWIPIGLMVCVHTHWKMLITKGWGSPSYIWSAVEKNGENNWKVRKIGQVVSQSLALGLKHDKIWAQWALNTSLESMLGKVWWCKPSDMESWNWTICCLMGCSNGGKHAWAKGSGRSHVTLRCC
jgi:hypothetical protein